MKKIVITCGLISGLIVASMMIVSTTLCYTNGNFDIGMVLGYTSMIIAFSLIYVGIKNYRDKHNNGNISFGKGFRIGLYITLIASSIYVIIWLIEYYFFIPDFTEKYAAHMMQKLQASGATQLEIDKQAKEMASFNEMYKNPLFNALITFTEVLPVGLLVSLISALLLKKKPMQTA